VPHKLRRENQSCNRKLLPTEVQAMKNMKDTENKAFPNESLPNGSTRSVSFPSTSIDVKGKEDLEIPMPYCLCHGIEPKPSILETKHCWEKGCPYLVFVKEVWISPETEKATKTQNSIEVKTS